MDISNMSQATLNLGFEEILCTSELDVVLLSSSASHMSKELPDMVKRDLFEFFCDREKICNLNKAKNYALGRWVSRYILNKHFGERENVLRRIVNSEAIETWGKPFVRVDSQTMNCSLSISHCDYLGVAGFSKDQEIGVDIDTQEIKSSSFQSLVLTETESEVVKYYKSASSELVAAFWTGKEAVSKVLGRGLQIPIKCFEIEIDFEKLYTKEMLCRFSSENKSEQLFSVRFFKRQVGTKTYTISVAQRG